MGLPAYTPGSRTPGSRFRVEGAMDRVLVDALQRPGDHPEEAGHPIQGF